MLEGDQLRARLKEIAARKGLGIPEWAAKANLANATLHNLMQGDNQSMRPATLRKLAVAVDMTLEELLADPQPLSNEDRILAAIEAMRREHTAILLAILEELRSARGAPEKKAG